MTLRLMGCRQQPADERGAFGIGSPLVLMGLASEVAPPRRFGLRPMERVRQLGAIQRRRPDAVLGCSRSSRLLDVDNDTAPRWLPRLVAMVGAN